MEIKNINVNELKKYNKNPRKNKMAVDKVAESIKEFGFKVPIVIDKDGVIIAGHTRLEAAKKLKLKDVPCIIADDLTEDQVRAFRLADNKVSEFSEWDIDLLNFELSEIDLNMDLFGFDDFEIEESGEAAEKKELRPYKKVHYLITADLNDNDTIIEIIEKLREMDGIEIESTLN